MTMTMPRTWFKVLIFYHRPDDGYRAFRLFMQLERRFNDEFMFENNLYPLEALTAPETGEQALYEASEADLIIAAMDTAAIPAFERWFHQIPTARTGQRRLVLNLSSNEEANATFRRLVARKGMDFISASEAKDFLFGEPKRVDSWQSEPEFECNWNDRLGTPTSCRRTGSSNLLETTSRR